MAFQLDDLLKDDKKDANLIPDLSKATCNSREEFQRLKEYCPEFKIKPEKVRILLTIKQHTYVLLFSFIRLFRKSLRFYISLIKVNSFV